MSLITVQIPLNTMERIARALESIDESLRRLIPIPETLDLPSEPPKDAYFQQTTEWLEEQQRKDELRSQGIGVED